MYSLAKHSLELDLNDKTWFKYTAFEGKSSLQVDSVTSLKSLPALAMLSGLAEVVFALLVFAIALSSLYLEESFPPLIAFLICLGSFLTVFITKRLLTFKKYGFGAKRLITVSQNQLQVAELAKKAKRGGNATIAKEDISEIIFNYTFLRKHKRTLGQAMIKKTAVLHTCEIQLTSGEVIALDPIRVGLFNVLYLLVFHRYPLSYRNTSAGGMGSSSIIVLRLLALGAIGNALIMLGDKLV